MDLLLQRLSSLENQMKEMNKRRQGRFNYKPQNQQQKQGKKSKYSSEVCKRTENQTRRYSFKLDDVSVEGQTGDNRLTSPNPKNYLKGLLVPPTKQP